MNPEIKQRLDQIRRGEVPEGYKKTKAGIVPSEWSCFTFGDIYAERKEAGDPELPILTVSIHSGVSDGALDEDEIGKKVKRIEDKTQYKKAHSGDLVFNMMRAWQGAIGVVRTKGLVSPAYIVANPKNSVYPLYMDFYMKTAEVINRIHRKSYGVTDFRLRLYWDSFAIIDCALPPLPEQQKIAEILTMQDKLIELQARKIEQLQALKKACLQRMFPKKGCDRPEIRFPEFTDAWEQRELRTAATFSKGSGYSKNDLKENGTPIILYGRLYTKYETVINEVDTFVDVQPNSVYSTGHEVIVPASGETAEDISRASFVAKSGILLGGDLNIIIPDDYINPVFLALTISNGNQQKELSKRAQGKSVVHIHNSDLENVVLLYPKYVEQETIGAYFSHLDHLITLHQRKLDEEKQKKKALMQLLLTGIVRVKV